MKQVKLEFARRKGPGGQHRNKVETAVVATHVPTGLTAEANEERSQASNRHKAVFRLRLRLAVELRSDLQNFTNRPPSDLWSSRLQGTSIVVNPHHPDFPALVTEALDWLVFTDADLPSTAARLNTTSSQLVKLLKKDARCWERVNQLRREQGLGTLK